MERLKMSKVTKAHPTHLSKQATEKSLAAPKRRGTMQSEQDRGAPRNAPVPPSPEPGQLPHCSILQAQNMS